MGRSSGAKAHPRHHQGRCCSRASAMSPATRVPDFPIMDVLADGQEILEELGVHFETSASEAAAAATLAAPVMYPSGAAVDRWHQRRVGRWPTSLRRVTGGALIIVGGLRRRPRSCRSGRMPFDEVADPAARSQAS